MGKEKMIEMCMNEYMDMKLTNPHNQYALTKTMGQKKTIKKSCLQIYSFD